MQTIFTSQKSFFNTRQTLDVDFRIAMMHKLKALIQDNEHIFMEAIHKDFGKSEFDTYTTELAMIYSEIDYFLKNIKRLARVKRTRNNLFNIPGKSYIVPEPLGVVLVIGAWNYPYQLTFLPVVTAIAAGNTCMIKPSELPINTSKVIGNLINSNFPSHYLYVIEGGVPETTELLKLYFDKIFFTGSPKVGKVVYKAAAQNLIPVTLELGGKSPVIVTSSANLRVAARRIVWGKFLNAGQTCIAPDYLLVHNDVKDELLKLIKERIEESAYLPTAPHYTNIINRDNFERLLSLIDRSKLFIGGEYEAKTRYIQPTVLEKVEWTDPIMQEEIFGPILPVLTYTNYVETIAYLRSLEKPLSAYLFSQDKQEKDQFRFQLSFGGGCINDVVMQATNRRLPFGGVGMSGMGNYHGEWGFKAFTHQKAMVDRMNWGEPKLKYPPYSNKKLAIAKKVF